MDRKCWQYFIKCAPVLVNFWSKRKNSFILKPFIAWTSKISPKKVQALYSIYVCKIIMNCTHVCLKYSLSSQSFNYNLLQNVLIWQCCSIFARNIFFCFILRNFFLWKIVEHFIKVFEMFLYVLSYTIFRYKWILQYCLLEESSTICQYGL